ncbi:hypothetical protein ABZ897_23570 [Nonomuraea sp. NPDC046802]|uniref:hypothetical protein n=1 Tax=Nonomuraea sp. NPDC046802 TaxID=3154919 RepID=UPI0033F557D1
MPGSVVTAVTLQLLLAATFYVIPVVAYVYGGRAQRAAEKEVVRQGFPADVLARHRIKMEESGRDMLFPFAIAVLFTVLGALNLGGSGAGRVLSWIFEVVLLVGGGFITASQVFVARYVEAAFRKSSDPSVRGLDGRAVVQAAQRELPSWSRALILFRFGLVTLGSILVIVALATPDASGHFR